MTDKHCPPFLEPRLRLFLSADIVGSTSLKQSRARPAETAQDATSGPVWFSAIQGFYFEAAQAFLSEWTHREAKSDRPKELYGDEPTFWKSVGDEVLFVKVLGDHRQVITTLSCWMLAVERMRIFLKAENPSLDVKCTAWVAGFPFRNREVVIGRYPSTDGRRVENYYQESGNLLNAIYNKTDTYGLTVDYIGPSIDTGFRLTGFSSNRKMVVSIDIAYFISMTSFDGEVTRIGLNYDGSQSLKGVMGGASYPIFWIDMSGSNSLASREDKLRAQSGASKETVKEYCDAFYQEYSSFTFRPFIKGDVGQTMAKMPPWYEGYHASLVTNFTLPDNEYAPDEEEHKEADALINPTHLKELLEEITPPAQMQPSEPDVAVGDRVRHAKFGDGTVVEVGGNRIVALFDTAGRKMVLRAFLKSIERRSRTEHE